MPFHDGCCIFELLLPIESIIDSLLPDVLLRSQVFVGGASQGGSDDLAIALADGTFQKKLEEAKAQGTPALPQDLMEVCARKRWRRSVGLVLLAFEILAQHQLVPVLTPPGINGSPLLGCRKEYSNFGEAPRERRSSKGVASQSKPYGLRVSHFCSHRVGVAHSHTLGCGIWNSP